MGINKCNTESGYPFFRYEAYCSNVMCEPKSLQVGVTILR